MELKKKLQSLLSDKPFKIVVKGTSMLPLLDEGDYVSVIKVQYKDINEGDIVLFKRDEENFLHRVIIKKDNFFYEAGDNQMRGSWVASSELIGKVTKIEKRDGKRYDIHDRILKRFSKRILLVQKLRYKRFDLKGRRMPYPITALFGKCYFYIEKWLMKGCANLGER